MSITTHKFTVTSPHNIGKGSILIVGDPHFKSDNTSNVNILIEEVVERSKTVDFVVILGDLLHFHERLFTQHLNKAYEFIQKIANEKKVYVIVGNHDYINNSQFLSDNHWMNAMKLWNNVYIIDSVVKLQTDFGVFVFCPYVPPQRFEEALSTVDDWKSATVIFAHQEIYGCKMGSIISEEGDAWKEDYPLLISGHIHDSQRLQNNVYYTGSALQHAFGESSDKGIVYCSISDSQIDVFSIQLNVPRKKILYMNLNELKLFSVEPNDLTQYRITVECFIDEFKQFKKDKKYKELIQKGIKIVLKQRNHSVSAQKNIKHESFRDILYRLVEQQNDTNMKEIYKSLITF
jgi:DNA repair exonuclease SbcCD nuclease subunit